jgi:FkbM family methyltransferase
VKGLLKILICIFNHPISKKNRLFAIKRFLCWQIAYRLVPYPVLYPFVEESKLLINKKMKGATGNIYLGLHEYEEMLFMLHLLRENDIFCDIGANIGSYTVLASKVIGATTYAFEPVPETFNSLKTNLFLNKIESKVFAFNHGLGEHNETLKFSINQDTINHVLTENEQVIGQDIEIKKLDDVLKDEIPLLIKIDVEGFEYFVLKGSQNILEKSSLKSIILEMNDETKRYDVSKDEINKFLLNYGFYPIRYNPRLRNIEKNGISFSDNRIYIRDTEFIGNRCKNARKINVFKQNI